MVTPPVYFSRRSMGSWAMRASTFHSYAHGIARLDFMLLEIGSPDVRRNLPMLKLVLFLPREHAVGGWRRGTAAIDPVAYRAERPIFFHLRC